MKKTIFLASCIILLFACEKEEIVDAEILGTWRLLNLTRTNITGYIDPIYLNEVITGGDTIDRTSQDNTEKYIRFDEDSTFSKFYFNDSINEIDEAFHWKYYRIGDTIYWGENGNIKYAISYLDKNNLHTIWETKNTFQNGSITQFTRSRNYRQLIRSPLP